MSTVTVHMHGAPGSPDDLHTASHPAVEIDLDRLTARARALAELWADAPLGCRTHVILESARTMREMGGDPEEAALWGWNLDRPWRMPWDSWSDYPPHSTLDPHDYLESQVQRMPMGYYPASRGRGSRAPSADAARGDADLLTRGQVLALLSGLGRPISAATMDNYRSRPPAGWPQPAQYVSRTPLWDRAAIERYAHATGSVGG